MPLHVKKEIIKSQCLITTKCDCNWEYPELKSR